MSRQREEWRNIPGYDGWYQLNRWGEVRSYRKKGNRHSRAFGERRDEPIILTPYMRKGKFLCVKLRRENEEKHHEEVLSRLMAVTWIGRIPDEMVVWLKDGDPTNVSLSNLMVTDKSEWVKTSLKASGFKNSKVKWPVLKIDRSLEIVAVYHSARQAAKANYYSYQGILDRCHHRCKTSVFAPDGFIYAWDDDAHLRKTLRLAMAELDRLGERYNDPFTECYYDLPQEADIDLNGILWADAPLAGGGLHIRNFSEGSVTA